MNGNSYCYYDCCWIAEEESRPGGEDEMVPPGDARRRGSTAGMKVRKGKNQSKSAVGADRQTAEGSTRID